MNGVEWMRYTGHAVTSIIHCFIPAGEWRKWIDFVTLRSFLQFITQFHSIPLHELIEMRMNEAIHCALLSQLRWFMLRCPLTSRYHFVQTVSLLINYAVVPFVTLSFGKSIHSKHSFLYLPSYRYTHWLPHSFNSVNCFRFACSHHLSSLIRHPFISFRAPHSLWHLPFVTFVN